MPHELHNIRPGPPWRAHLITTPDMIYLVYKQDRFLLEPYTNDIRLQELSEQIVSNAYLVVEDDSGNIVAAVFGKLEPVQRRI
mgnify:CR=1 FL=1